MKKFFLIASFIFLSHTAFALLSPLDQSIVEMKEILSSSELSLRLKNSESIQAIYRFEDGYVVMTDVVQMIVDIEVLPTDKPGPKQFKLHFHEPTFRK